MIRAERGGGAGESVFEERELEAGKGAQSVGEGTAHPSFGGISLGGHPWEVPVIVLVIALFILALNAPLEAEKLGLAGR